MTPLASLPSARRRGACTPPPWLFMGVWTGPHGPHAVRHHLHHLLCIWVWQRAGSGDNPGVVPLSLPPARHALAGMVQRVMVMPSPLPPPVEFIGRTCLERLPHVGVPDTFELSVGRVAPWVIAHVSVSGAVGWRTGCLGGCRYCLPSMPSMPS